MKWKIYFVAYILMTVFNIPATLQVSPAPNVASYLGILESFLYVIALYAYIRNRKIFTPKVWGTVLALSIISTLIQFVIVAAPNTLALLNFAVPNVPVTIDAFGYGLIFMIPSWIATYRLSKGIQFKNK
jgi:hypothetical protein